MVLNIIKDFIKLNQSVALFPLRAAKKLLDDRNTGTKQMLDVAEDFVSAPFIAAERAFDRPCRSCSENDGEKSAKRYGTAGPAYRNILADPSVEIYSDIELNPGERKAELTVIGLLCGG